MLTSAFPAFVLTLAAQLPSASSTYPTPSPDCAESSADEGALGPIAELVVPELVALAEWCEGEKLLASRLAAYEAVLVWRPDHADARRILGFRKGKGGAWERSRPEAARRDRTGLEAELAARRGAIVDRALALCERSAEALGPAGLRLAHERLVTVAPDHEALRAALGQARLEDGRWVRAETAAAQWRDAERKALVAEWKALVEVERVEVTALEEGARRASVKWAGVARTSESLVASAVSYAEAEAIAVATTVAPDVARAALPPPSSPLADAEGRRPLGDAGHARAPRYYVVQSNADRDALLGSLGAELEPRKAALLRRVATGFLDAHLSIGVWTASPSDRLEAAVRQRVGLYLQRTFGVSSDDGWVWEGVGLLLSGAVTGTKNLVYVQLTPSGQTAAASGRTPRDWQLFGPGADWLAMARDLLRQGPGFNLARLLAKDVNTMDKEDLLVAHALGTWLIDGKPERAQQILARIGAGQPPVEVFEQELGMRLPAILDELRGWLGEMRP